jgi:hypothetical protein
MIQNKTLLAELGKFSGQLPFLGLNRDFPLGFEMMADAFFEAILT